MSLQVTQNVYGMPIPAEKVTQTVVDNHSHTGPYEGSIDYAVPLGTKVVAAADGTVVRVRDDSEKYGNDIKYGQDVNYISILHDHDEISEYLHLAKSSALVKVGDRVKVGQIIAKTGLSGYMTAPHLHFMVYSSAMPEFKCRRVKFHS